MVVDKRECTFERKCTMNSGVTSISFFPSDMGSVFAAGVLHIECSAIVAFSSCNVRDVIVHRQHASIISLLSFKAVGCW